MRRSSVAPTSAATAETRVASASLLVSMRRAASAPARLTPGDQCLAAGVEQVTDLGADTRNTRDNRAALVVEQAGGLLRRTRDPRDDCGALVVEKSGSFLGCTGHARDDRRALVVEQAGGFLGCIGDAGDKGAGLTLEQIMDGLARLGQALHQIAALFAEQPMHRGADFRDPRGQVRAMAVDGPGQLLAGLVDPQDDGVAALAQYVIDGPGRLVQAADQGFALGADERMHGLANLLQARGDRLVLAGEQAVDAAADLGKPGGDAFAFLGQQGAQAFAGLGEALADSVGLALDQGDDGAAGILQALCDIRAALGDLACQRVAGGPQRLVHRLDALRQRVGNLRTGFADGPRHFARAGAQFLGQRSARALQRSRNLAGPPIEQGRKLVAGAGQPLADLARRQLQALDQLVAATADLLDHALSGAAERQRDLVALLAERTGHPVAGLGHRLRDDAAGIVEILGQPFMGAADRKFHPLGITDHGFALRHQLVDQRAQADFIVGIGALERRDLAAHDGLKLTGARNRALDAVAHGGDFAADGLAQRQDGIGADHFRLGQAQRHLGHGARHQPHFLGPAVQRGQDEEEDHGRAGRESQQRPFAQAKARQRLRHAGRERAIAADDDEGDASEPGQRAKPCKPVRLQRRARRKGLDQRAGIAAVIIGDAGCIGRDQGAGSGRRLGRWLGGRRRRLDAGQVELQVGLCGRRKPRPFGSGLRLALRLIEPQSLLDGRHGGLGRVLKLILPGHASRLATPLKTGIRLVYRLDPEAASGPESRADTTPIFTNPKGS